MDREVYMKIEEICTIVFLAVNAWTDYRKKEISLVITGIYAAAGIVFSIVSKRGFGDMMIPLVIGALFLLLSLISGGDLGMGDGWTLLALGMMIRTDEYISMIGLSMLLAAGVSVLLLAVFRKNRKTEIPFIPFLFLAYMGGVML